MQGSYIVFIIRNSDILFAVIGVILRLVSLW